jgi:hypothetical protein
MAFNTLAFLLGYRCGIRCRNCLWGSRLGDRETLDPSEAIAWLEQARALADVRLIGFSDGESFLYQREILVVARYAWGRHGIPCAISTNSSWATNLDRTERRLRPLHEAGLRELLLSVDDFHQEHVPLDRVRFALEAARKLGIQCTLQCIVTEHSRKLATYLEALGVSPECAKADHNGPIRATQIYCTRLGAAMKLPDSEFAPKANALSSYCSMLGPLVLAPNGDVHLCCGPAFSIQALTAGNLRREPLSAILQRAEWDSIYNALALGHGPELLATGLRDCGLEARVRSDYSTSCEACVHLLSQPGVETALRAHLEPRQGELFLKRNILAQETAESLSAMLRV